MELRNVECSLKDGRAMVGGEVLLSVLYSEEEESSRLQWYETTVPLACGVDCAVEGENSVYKVKINPVMMELEVKPDYDGEERILVMELALDMDIRVWQEQEVNLLGDIYSLNRTVTPVRRERMVEKLLVKNYAKSRITEQMELAESQEKILQICACEGKVSLEKKEKVENGVIAEGTVMVELLYITTDDNMPVGTVREFYPFSQLIEIPDMKQPLGMELECGIEQLSAVMLDQEHIEIKAVIHLGSARIFRADGVQYRGIKRGCAGYGKITEQPGTGGVHSRSGCRLVEDCEGKSYDHPGYYGDQSVERRQTGARRDHFNCEKSVGEWKRST